LILDTAFLFAMGAAFSFACADMGMRSGLQHTDPFVGATISRLVGALTLLGLVLIAGVRFPPIGAVLWRKALPSFPDTLAGAFVGLVAALGTFAYPRLLAMLRLRAPRVNLDAFTSPRLLEAP
jgi:uncharacterized membrane protein